MGLRLWGFLMFGVCGLVFEVEGSKAPSSRSPPASAPAPARVKWRVAHQNEHAEKIEDLLTEVNVPKQMRFVVGVSMQRKMEICTLG